jgi:hypothetical protein
LANELLASEIERGDLRASLVSVRQTISNFRNISTPEFVNWFKDTFDLYTKAELDEFARIEREKVVHLAQERAMKEQQTLTKMKEEIEQERLTSIDEVKQQEFDAKKVQLVIESNRFLDQHNSGVMATLRQFLYGKGPQRKFYQNYLERHSLQVIEVLECPLCLQRFEPHDFVVGLRCSKFHAFHEECVQ